MFRINDCESTGHEPADRAANRAYEVDRPMSTREVAAYLGLSERQVLRMVHNGQMPARKFGHNWYFSPRKVAALVGMDE